MLKDITLGQYFPGKSPVHLLDPRCKLIMLVIFARRLARTFGKSGWFALGLVLLNPIFIMILGFGKAEYGYYPSSKDVVSTWECSSCGHQNPAYLRICEQCAKDKE